MEANWASDSDVVSNSRFELYEFQPQRSSRIHFLDHFRVCRGARDAGVGEASGIRHVMGFALVDCKLDRVAGDAAAKVRNLCSYM
jgi:hypothetical protein